MPLLPLEEIEKTMNSVTITLEDDYLDNPFEGFDCRGRIKNLCDGCRLRFKCLSERNEVQISADVIKKYDITDLRSVVAYMFGEGRINYTIHEDRTDTGNGNIKLAMVVE